MKAEGLVYVVDDDAAIREAVSVLLDASGLSCRTYPSAEAFLSIDDDIRPRCLLLDIRMPGMNGLDLQEEMARRGIHMPVIMITGDGDVPAAVRAMKAGAMDFLEKPFRPAHLLDLVREALKADRSSQEAADTVRQAQARLSQLSRREREVFALLIQGDMNKVVGRKLGISTRTVEAHRANLMRKLEARSLSDLVRLAMSSGEQI